MMAVSQQILAVVAQSAGNWQATARLCLILAAIALPALLILVILLLVR